MMSHDPYNTTNEDAVSNLSMLSTSTMRSSLYFHEKPDRFEQQAGPLADILDLHQDLRDRQASGTSSNSQGVVYTVYVVIFEGRKFRRFHCKLVEREILILEKEAVA